MYALGSGIFSFGGCRMATLTKSGKRVGRPPSPPGLTVKDAPYERKEYADRLRAIVDAVEVGDLSKDVELYLQMLIRRYDLLSSRKGR